MGRNALVNLETNCEYIAQTMGQRLSIAQNMAQDVSNYKKPLEEIAQEGVKVARRFIIQNDTVLTREMHNKVNYKIQSNQILLYDDAKDKRGRYYAMHIEYGFKGNGPWPFLRPALRHMSVISTGKLEKEMKNIIENNQLAYGSRMTPSSLGSITNKDRDVSVSKMREAFGSGTVSQSSLDWKGFSGYGGY